LAAYEALRGSDGDAGALQRARALLG
jgi:hypothetical protein